MTRCTIEDLRGGTAEENAEALRLLLSGGDQSVGPAADTVILNAGICFHFACYQEFNSFTVIIIHYHLFFFLVVITIIRLYLYFIYYQGNLMV